MPRILAFHTLSWPAFIDIANIHGNAIYAIVRIAALLCDGTRKEIIKIGFLFNLIAKLCFHPRQFCISVEGKICKVQQDVLYDKG